MAQRNIILVSLLLAGFLTISTSFAAHAQSGGGYDLTWSTIDGGGYTFSAGDGYILGGTIGQADASAMTGGVYILHGGFWSSLSVVQEVYLPLLVR